MFFFSFGSCRTLFFSHLRNIWWLQRRTGSNNKVLILIWLFCMIDLKLPITNNRIASSAEISFGTCAIKCLFCFFLFDLEISNFQSSKLVQNFAEMKRWSKYNLISGNDNVGHWYYIGILMSSRFSQKKFLSVKSTTTELRF